MLFSAYQRENLNADVRNLRIRRSFHLQIVVQVQTVIPGTPNVDSSSALSSICVLKAV